MFSQPFALRQIGSAVLASNSTALDCFVGLLIVVSVAALAYGGYLLAKAPDRSPRVHLKPEHCRRRRRRAQ